MKYWLKIKLNGVILDPILLFDGKKRCLALSMPTLECTIPIRQKSSEISVDFIYCEGNSCTEIASEKLFIQKEGGFANAVSSFLGGSKVRPTKIDIFFNENQEGLCIGFLANSYKATKYIVNDKYRGDVFCTGREAETLNQSFSGSNNCNTPTAKEVFQNNYTLFGEVLRLSGSNNYENIAKEWANIILRIPDGNILLDEFNKYRRDLDAWIKLLCSWGLKQDTCKKYPGCLITEDRYKTDNLCLIDSEAYYEVLVPCWTIWINQDGVRKEHVVSYGFVKKI